MNNPAFLRSYLQDLWVQEQKLTPCDDDIESPSESDGEAAPPPQESQEVQTVKERIAEINRFFVERFGEKGGMSRLEEVYRSGSIEAGKSPSPQRDRRGQAVTPVLPVGNEHNPYFDARAKTTSQTPKLKRKHSGSPPKLMGVYHGKRSRSDSSGFSQTTLSPQTPADHVISLRTQASNLGSELAKGSC